MASHQEAAWYLNKAEECERFAKEATDPHHRAGYEHDARLWREIAAEIEKRKAP